MGNMRDRADLRPSIKSVMSSVTFTTKITAESVAIRLKWEVARMRVCVCVCVCVCVLSVSLWTFKLFHICWTM
jgi:hypothetical protein